jgi:hypothetical protein
MNEKRNDLDYIIKKGEDEILNIVENDKQFLELANEISNNLQTLSNGDYFIDSTNSKIVIFNNINEFDKSDRNYTNPVRVGNTSGDIQVFREAILKLELNEQQIYSLLIWCRFEYIINGIWKNNSEWFYTNSYFYLADLLTIKHCVKKGFPKELLIEAGVRIIPPIDQHNQKRIEELLKLK